MLRFVSRSPGRPSPDAKRPIRAVIRFPDSAEIRHLDGVPSPGTRLRSASGNEWLVAEALRSGRDTYTVFCVGREEPKEADIPSAQTRLSVVGEVADELLQRARRTVREQYRPQPDMAFVASFVSADGRVFQDFIRAKTLALAESEALERARGRNLTLSDVQRGPDWWLESVPGQKASRRRRRWGRLVRRGR
jgi:hypothetical protein